MPRYSYGVDAKFTTMNSFLKRSIIPQRIIIILLILILFIVSIPYILQGFNLIQKWKEQREVTKINKAQQMKEEKAIKLQEELLSKYKITTLEKDYSYTGSNFEYPIYSLPERVFDYLEAKKKIEQEYKDYSCENPTTPTPKPTSDLLYNYYKVSDSFLYKNLLTECKVIADNQNYYLLFNSELPNITNLISDNKSSQDKVILSLVNKLTEDFASLNKLK